ncbi:MAG: hypothetical protein H0X03_07020, partial [Nitrosopumilus sp.]|nr:hypothetical protein [Nitrosopumilus sp.]
MSNHILKKNDVNINTSKSDLQQSSQMFVPSISLLKFPFILKEDQLAAVDAWINNNYRGTILYSTGTGKTEIAFECARRKANYSQSSVTISVEDTSSKTNINNPLPLHTSVSSPTNSTILEDTKYTSIKKTGTKINNNINCSFFNILFLVPRISLIDQTIKRLLSYGIPEEKVGAYFGERKEIREIIISTYHSIA